jgi:hypothetical protein
MQPREIAGRAIVMDGREPAGEVRSNHGANLAAIPLGRSSLVGLTITLATFMEVLDTAIANVSLPHMAGSLSVSQDEATWVLTSYLSPTPWCCR